MWLYLKNARTLVNTMHVVSIREFNPEPEHNETEWALGLIYFDGSRDVLRYKAQEAMDADAMVIRAALKPIIVNGR